MKHESVVPTTEDNYITALAALNIPCEEGTGDWHFRSHYFPNRNRMPKQKLAGKDYLSTKEWLGNEGIYDCYPILVDWGVNVTERKIYAANHYRAVVDMVFHQVKSGANIEQTINLDDWLPEPHEKNRVYMMLDKLKAAFSKAELQAINKWKNRGGNQ